MNRLFVIRPEPGCSATVEAAQAAGLAAEGYPMFAIEPRAWNVTGDPSDAVLLGSANALRHAGPQLAALRHLPAYAVGETTAATARDAGFATILTGSGGLQTVLDRLAPDHRQLLRLTGAERIELIPPLGVTITEHIVYAAVPVPLPHALARRLMDGGIVLLHSAAATQHFAAECDRLAIDRTRIRLAALGPRIAAAAGGGWRHVRSAERPDDAALLALAAQLCQ